MSLKQRTIKFKPRIKLNHNIVYTKQKLIFILRRGTWKFTVLSFFSSSISVILILMCNIAVSSTCSLVVCSFSSFWLTIFERRSFTVLQYHFIRTLPSKTVNKAPLGFFLKVFLEKFFKLFGFSFHIFVPARENAFFCISSRFFYVEIVWFPKISRPPPRRELEIPGRWGGQRPRKFQRGGGLDNKITFRG